MVLIRRKSDTDAYTQRKVSHVIRQAEVGVTQTSGEIPGIASKPPKARARQGRILS